VHSLHAYFLRRGDCNSPIVYEVDRAWDGKHFATRRVVAIQHGQQIFNMSASFQIPEIGLEHQIPMPEVPMPEALPDFAHYLSQLTDLSPALLKILEQKRPFDFKPVEPPTFARKNKSSPHKHVWIRAVGALPDDEALHRCLLAYASDFQLLDTALKPHALSPARDKLVVASIDHAMWFHRTVRVDDWLLYAMDSPSASGARGFTRGSVFARDGRLVASVSQEGLIRVSSG
jgi:acyl-CoA thioesterase II